MFSGALLSDRWCDSGVIVWGQRTQSKSEGVNLIDVHGLEDSVIKVTTG